MLRALALFAIAALVPAEAFGGAVRVVSVASPCPDSTTAAIERETAPLADRAGDLVLHLAPAGAGQLRLRLEGARAPHETVIPFHRDDCPALPQTAALLLRSWLDTDWRRPVSPPPPPAPSPPNADVVPEQTPTPSRRVLLHLTAGAFLAPTGGSIGPALGIGAGLALGPTWGLELSGAYQGQVSAAAGPGRASAALSRITAAARLRLPLLDSASLDLIAGPSLCLVSAQSQGLPHADTRVAADIALFASARWRQWVTSRWALLAGAELTVRRTEEVLSIRGLGEVLRVERTRLGAFLGAEWAAY